MPLNSVSHTEIASGLTRRAGPTASSAQIAVALDEAWQEIEAALSPVIGKAGAVALLRRSARLTSRAHPWLEPGMSSISSTIKRPLLGFVFERQEAAAALEAASALLDALYQLLAGLIGPGLTERLIGFLRHVG